jgi:hypothetical protein
MDDKTQAKLKDIKEHPESHRHDFDGLQRCSMINGALDMMVMEAHPALGYNGGQKCDVSDGPCSCGAWH